MRSKVDFLLNLSCLGCVHNISQEQENASCHEAEGESHHRGDWLVHRLEPQIVAVLEQFAPSLRVQDEIREDGASERAVFRLLVNSDGFDDGAYGVR